MAQSDPSITLAVLRASGTDQAYYDSNVQMLRECVTMTPRSLSDCQEKKKNFLLTDSFIPPWFQASSQASLTLCLRAKLTPKRRRMLQAWVSQQD